MSDERDLYEPVDTRQDLRANGTASYRRARACRSVRKGRRPARAHRRWLRHSSDSQLTGLNRNVMYSQTKYLLVDPLSDNPLVVSGSANFSDPSVQKNDENMLIIQGDTRVADIYLGEFMRVFNHFYFRYLQQNLHDPAARDTAHLVPDDSWVDRYYNPTTPSHRQRLLFR